MKFGEGEVLRGRPLRDPRSRTPRGVAVPDGATRAETVRLGRLRAPKPDFRDFERSAKPWPSGWLTGFACRPRCFFS